jgi:hypothetical protein
VAGSDTLKRVLIGRALRTQQLDAPALPKQLALPLFCSDPISSVAYDVPEAVRQQLDVRLVSDVADLVRDALEPVQEASLGA